VTAEHFGTLISRGIGVLLIALVFPDLLGAVIFELFRVPFATYHDAQNPDWLHGFLFWVQLRFASILQILLGIFFLRLSRSLGRLLAKNL
jgi:hypothetical protein